MHFYFVRHGQSENNRLWMQTGSYQGRSPDPDLTEMGRQQALKLAEFLGRPPVRVTDQALRSQATGGAEHDPQNVGGFSLTHLYCSLMVRAVATGVVVARALNLPLVAWVDAHEVGGIDRIDEESGERIGLPGKNRTFFKAHYPDLVLPTWLGDEGWWHRPYEEPEERVQRADRFLHDLLARHGGSGDRVAVISHGAFYNHLMCAIFGMSWRRDRWLSLNNVGITRIDFDEEAIWLHYANRVDFLPPNLIS
jgi:2,3-bisphosphoglycerate-dependent phosphoglycerate mutase